MTETEAKPRILETAEEVAPPAASSPSPERKKEKKHLRWSNLSYTTRVTLAFALIAAMTALVAIGVVSFVWEQHFRTYTADNMQTLCETTANRIAAIYEETGDLWNPETTRPAAQATGRARDRLEGEHRFRLIRHHRRAAGRCVQVLRTAGHLAGGHGLY